MDGGDAAAQHLRDVGAVDQRQAGVVVIGGGIIGAGTALTLAERGISVALCEKGHVGGEQSSRNWGWCRKMGRDLAEIPLAIESLRLWEGMNARTGAETGFRRTGIVYLGESHRDVEKHAAWLGATRQFQIDSRIIGSNEIDRLLPGSSRRWPGALYTPSDGVAEPEQATKAIARAAAARGAAILEQCAARGIETAGGRVSAVVTERGSIRCGQVVLAGGAWSSLFCGNLGIRFPQLKVLGSVMRTVPLAGPVPAAGASNFAFRKRADGGYTIAQRNANLADIVPDSFRYFADFAPSLIMQWHELRLRIGRRFIEEWQVPRRWQLDGVTPFEQVRVLDPAPSKTVLRQGLRNLNRAFPGFRDVKIGASWAGLIDVTPDAVPVISRVAAIPGFYIASGFSGHGFGIGPAASHLMADLLTGAAPLVDPKPYALERLL
jgi:glycine/D-amino acid oxidase-like deaminating enzyme